jgi:hypothetical protein
MTRVSKWALTGLGLAILMTVPAVAQTSKTSASKTSRIERSLAGVRIGTKASELTRRFKNPPPTLALGAGGGADESANPFGASPGGFSSAGPGALPGMGMPMPGGVPMPGGMPMGGGMPMAGPSVNPFAPAGDGTETAAQGSGPAVTYTWRNFLGKKGFDFQAQVDEDGRVIQLVGSSLSNVGIRTARNIGFGSTYSDVLAAYGWPEAHTMSGNFIQASYQETAHVAFQFLNYKVVRIIVADVQ